MQKTFFMPIFNQIHKSSYFCGSYSIKVATFVDRIP